MKKIITMLCLAFVVVADTWYQGTGGNDGNSGATWELRKLTVQCVMDSVQAGDSVFLQGQAITTKIDVDMNGGAHASPTVTTPIYVFGVDGSGNILTGTTLAWISTTESISALCSLSVNADYFRWRNIGFRAGGTATSCIVTPSADGVDNQQFYNCRWTNASVHNINARWAVTVGTEWTIESSEIDSAGRSGTGNGLNILSTSRCPIRFANNRVHNNDSIGVMFGGVAVSIIEGNIFYSNGSDGCQLYSSYNYVKNNSLYGNGGDGYQFAQNVGILSYTNNIASGNTGYGVNTSASSLEYWKVFSVHHNCNYNNTAGVIDINDGTMPGENNITTDPGFVSTTEGSENFAVTGTAQNAGVNPNGY